MKKLAWQRPIAFMFAELRQTPFLWVHSYALPKHLLGKGHTLHEGHWGHVHLVCHTSQSMYVGHSVLLSDGRQKPVLLVSFCAKPSKELKAHNAVLRPTQRHSWQRPCPPWEQQGSGSLDLSHLQRHICWALMSDWSHPPWFGPWDPAQPLTEDQDRSWLHCLWHMPAQMLVMKRLEVVFARLLLDSCKPIYLVQSGFMQNGHITAACFCTTSLGTSMLNAALAITDCIAAQTPINWPCFIFWVSVKALPFPDSCSGC